MDPELWANVVTHVRDTFTVREPANAALFAERHDRYVAELTRLDAYGRRVLGSVPRERRLLVTAHDAFAYMARAYEIEVMGVQGLSTESEAGLRRIEEVVATVVARRVPAIFVESSVGDRNIRAVVEGASRRGHAVRVGGELFSDAMGAPNTHEGTYIGMMDHNFTTISRGLGGDAPARGMDGRLAA
jgi:manganese/zinc/iron transport system substrate-binding protein